MDAVDQPQRTASLLTAARRGLAHWRSWFPKDRSGVSPLSPIPNDTTERPTAPSVGRHPVEPPGRGPSYPRSIASLPPFLRSLIPQASQGYWLNPGTRFFNPAMIESVLRLGLSGDLVGSWQLFQVMEDTWPRLNKNLLELKRAVIGLDREIIPFSTPGQAPTESARQRAALVESILFDLRPTAGADENDFSGTVFDLLDAWAKGVAVLEIDWEIRATPTPGRTDRLSHRLAPRATRWVHPQHYGWVAATGSLELRLPDNPSSIASAEDRSGYRPFPPDKFLVAVCKARSGIATAGALLRPLAFWWAAANLSAEWLLNFAQVFGMPIRWATYDPHNPSLLPVLEDMLAQLGNSGWAAFPTGTQLELKEAARVGGDNPQAYVQTLADRLCDILILGQTLTTDVPSSGSRALGHIHKSVRDEAIEAAGRWVDDVINRQWIPALLRVNFGDASEAPTVVSAARRPEDAVALAQRDQLLLREGVRLPQSWFYQRHDIPEPRPGEPVVQTQPEPVGKGPLPETLPDTSS